MSVALGFACSLVPCAFRPTFGMGDYSALAVGGPLGGRRLSLADSVPVGPYLDFFATVPGPGGSDVPFWYRLCDFEAVELSGIRWWVLVPRWVALSRRRCGAFAPAVRAAVSRCVSATWERGRYVAR